MGEKINIERKVVEYKGDKFILNVGYSVFGCNLKTGEVTQAELKLKGKNFISTLLGFKSNVNVIIEKPNHLYIPAFDIYKAKVRFKKLFGKNLKIKGV